uniref:Putative ovule protein n=1 Tax=Solanum chacoense TaxID=4108 RepID=A0A0V0HI14_SOLCH
MHEKLIGYLLKLFLGGFFPHKLKLRAISILTSHKCLNVQDAHPYLIFPFMNLIPLLNYNQYGHSKSLLIVASS